MTHEFRAYQRAVLISVVLAAVCLVVLALAGHIGLGMLLCVGVGLGAANTALTHLATLRHVHERTDDRRNLVVAAAVRLGVVAAIAIAFAVAFWPDGIGVLIGLTAFQVVLFAMTALRPGERPA